MLFTLAQQEKHPVEVVVLTDAVYQSSLGKYFFGQTDLITFGGGYNAWGGLINPAGSKVNMFLNAYTISNFSHQSLTAEGWLGSTIPENVKTSPYVAAGNQAMTPEPKPKIEIQSANYLSKAPIGGTYTFVRRVEPDQTLTKHDFQGMYIIPPASSIILYFLSPGNEMVKVRVAFGWWEKDVVQ